MISKKLERKSVKKMALAAVAIIGTCTLLFQGVLQVATAMEVQKTNEVPTQYSNDSAVIETISNSFPEGYEKADYKIGKIDLEYYHNQKPTSTDIIKEDAAEIGAQALWTIFDVSLEGQLIEMGYQQATESFPRSSWYADVIINEERSYYFAVDSVTGELLNVGLASRTLEENVSVAFDVALDKDAQEFISVAQQLAEKHNVVNGAIESVRYNGQGYSNNDPTISFDIVGENGEIALMSLSRHDQTLLGIVYSASYKHTLEFHEKFQEKVRALEKLNPHDKEEGESPLLRPVDLN